MLEILNLTNEPIQELVGELEDDINISYTLGFRYIELHRIWMLTIEAPQKNNFIITGLTATSNTNLLDPWRNIINFGLFLLTDRYIEPTFLDDFSTKRVRVLLLNKEELSLSPQQIRDFYYNKVDNG